MKNFIFCAVNPALDKTLFQIKKDSISFKKAQNQAELILSRVKSFMINPFRLISQALENEIY